MNKQEATRIAEEYVEKNSKECSLFYDNIIEFEYGYCFVWNSNKYIKTRDINDMLVGPAPFIVSNVNEEIYCLGSAYSMESLIEEYTNQYEDEHKIYSLWPVGELKNSSFIRQKYDIPINIFKNIVNGIALILMGSKNRLQKETTYIESLGNNVEIKKT